MKVAVTKAFMQEQGITPRELLLHAQIIKLEEKAGVHSDEPCQSEFTLLLRPLVRALAEEVVGVLQQRNIV